MHKRRSTQGAACEGTGKPKRRDLCLLLLLLDVSQQTAAHNCRRCSRAATSLSTASLLSAHPSLNSTGKFWNVSGTPALLTRSVKQSHSMTHRDSLLQHCVHADEGVVPDSAALQHCAVAD